MTVSLTQDTDKGGSSVLGRVQHTLKEPSNGQNDPLTVRLYGYTTVAVTLDACGTLSLSPARASPCTPAAAKAGRTDVSSQCNGGQCGAIRITLRLGPLTLVRVVGPHRSDGVVTCALVRLGPEEYPGCREMRTEMLSILMGHGGPRRMGISKCFPKPSSQLDGPVMTQVQRKELWMAGS